MALVLYVGSKHSSSWSLRAYLALAHAGADFETRVILLDRGSTRDAIAAIGPTGRVPVLHHDGLVVWDSMAICEYAAELYPTAGLWPADRAQRARARAISAEMHSSFVALRTNMPFDPLSRKPGQGHVPDALADARRIQDIWRDALAASGGPFLFGGFTIADAMFAPVATRFTTYGVELDAICSGYRDAIAAVPAMQAWLADAAKEPRADG